MVLGSEGRLGIITEATVHVHRIPERAHRSSATCSRTGAARSQAMRAIAESDAAPSVTRVSDGPETRVLVRDPQEAPTAVDRLKSKGLTAFLERKSSFGDLERMCLAFIGYEGSQGARRERSASSSAKIVSAHGGVCIGSSPGELYDQKKFDTPVHPRLPARPRRARRRVGDLGAVERPARPLRQRDGGGRAARSPTSACSGYIMCHLSHSYHAGACLYFTFAFRPGPVGEALDQYDRVKGAIQQAFIDCGRDAVAPPRGRHGARARGWRQDISAPGVAMLRALFDGVDPGANLNPGKIVGAERRLEHNP